MSHPPPSFRCMTSVGDANQWKYAAHVHLDVHPDVGGGRTGADTEPKDTGNVSELLRGWPPVGHSGELVGEGGIPPATLGIVGPSLRCLSGGKPGQARVLHEA